MMNGICYLSVQNVTSFSVKVTPEVTPEIPYSIYTNTTFLVDCYLVTSNIRAIHGKNSRAYTRARACACVYTRTSIFGSNKVTR